MKYLDPRWMWKEAIAGGHIKPMEPLPFPGRYPTRIIYGWEGKMIYCGKPNAKRMAIFFQEVQHRRSRFFCFGEYDRNGMIGAAHFLGMWFDGLNLMAGSDGRRWRAYHPYDPVGRLGEIFRGQWEIKRIKWPDGRRIQPIYWAIPGEPLKAEPLKVSAIKAHKEFLQATYVGREGELLP